ncbi:MAG: hypothetical protein AB1916_13280 [Thermodesulfobacteriota bacterium]
MPNPLAAVLASVRSALSDSVRISLDLYKVMIPIIVAVKILKELDLIGLFALPLSPLMALVGLPDSMGLVWATGILNNIYAALLVFAALAPAEGVTVAQCTVLCTMLLIAHNLPVECKVAQKCGPSLWGQAAARLLGALACGWLLHAVYSSTGTLGEANRILWTPQASPQGALAWALGEARNLAAIFGIILALMLAMRLLTALRVTALLDALLRPVLRAMGIGPDASMVTVVGLALGLTYGSGLIIHEARAGRIGRRDVFYAVTLLGLSHALIEDTMLMALMGAHVSGILWGRLAFSLIALFLLVRATRGLSDEKFERLFMSKG